MAVVRSPQHQQHELRREAATMALYVSVVLLAELAAIPAHEVPKGWAMVALVWGTTIGLALAHWFAFTVASQALAGGHLDRQDLEVGAAGVGGALVVAVVASLPELMLADSRDAERVVLFVPAAVIGVGGFLVARAAGRTTPRSMVWALVFLLAGAAVATVKLLLGGH